MKKSITLKRACNHSTCTNQTDRADGRCAGHVQALLDAAVSRSELRRLTIMLGAVRWTNVEEAHDEALLVNFKSNIGLPGMQQ